MLAYGSPADQLDEVLKIAASTTLECLGKFAKGVIECFGPEYLRPPTAEELEKILLDNEARGFPGHAGSVDCMHWPWHNCPKGWSGQFTSGLVSLPLRSTPTTQISSISLANAKSSTDKVIPSTDSAYRGYSTPPPPCRMRRGWISRLIVIGHRTETGWFGYEMGD
jgi:hypothetical protein